jgi:hypothetical protein
MAHRLGHCPETRLELGPRQTRLRQQDPGYATHVPAIVDIILEPDLEPAPLSRGAAGMANFRPQRKRAAAWHLPRQYDTALTLSRRGAVNTLFGFS